jgi:hypothetical protein
MSLRGGRQSGSPRPDWRILEQIRFNSILSSFNDSRIVALGQQHSCQAAQVETARVIGGEEQGECVKKDSVKRNEAS